MENSPLLQARNLSKRYIAVQALAETGIDILSGEVHALIGSNGAGKSTLVKILTGAVEPDSGEVLLGGKPVPLGVPKLAMDAGIACIYQESNLVPALSVMDNIVLGRHPVTSMGLLDRKKQRKFVSDLLNRNELKLDLDTPVQLLTTVQQKEVEIAKALSLNARVILMDEPTAWLSQVEVENLFNTIRKLKKDGVGILYISHVLDEIFKISDRVTVMRDGKVVHSGPVKDISKSNLVQAMLGRELTRETEALMRSGAKKENPEVAVKVSNLGKIGLFSDISFQVHRGEIVCITGLIGAKRSELIRTIFGAEKADNGEIHIFGKPVKIQKPVDAIRLGLGLIPEDRHRDGLLMGLSMNNNLVMAYLNRGSRLGILLHRVLRAMGKKQIERLSITPAKPDLPVRNLSGGNQQKVLIGRWLAGDADIILLDEPTVGVDVGAKSDIYQLLHNLAEGGAAVLIVSSDMEEVMTVADRVLVMSQGRLCGSFNKGEFTQEQILKAASGEAIL